MQALFRQTVPPAQSESLVQAEAQHPSVQRWLGQSMLNWQTAAAPHRAVAGDSQTWFKHTSPEEQSLLTLQLPAGVVWHPATPPITIAVSRVEKSRMT